MSDQTAESAYTCTCTDPAVACPSCVARRDCHGWPKDWRERMRPKECGSDAADWCLAPNGTTCTKHDRNGDRRG